MNKKIQLDVVGISELLIEARELLVVEGERINATLLQENNIRDIEDLVNKRKKAEILENEGKLIYKFYLSVNETTILNVIKNINTMLTNICENYGVKEMMGLPISKVEVIVKASDILIRLYNIISEENMYNDIYEIVQEKEIFDPIPF